MSAKIELPVKIINADRTIDEVDDDLLIAVDGLKNMWLPLWNAQYIEPFEQTLQELREEDTREPDGTSLFYPVEDFVFRVGKYDSKPNPSYGDAFKCIDNFIEELKGGIHPGYVDIEGKKIFIHLPVFRNYVNYHFARVQKPAVVFSIGYSTEPPEKLDTIIQDYSPRLAALPPVRTDDFNYENACLYVAARIQLERTEGLVKKIDEIQKGKVGITKEKPPAESTISRVTAKNVASRILSYPKTRPSYKRMLSGLIEYLDKIISDKDYAQGLQYDNEKAVVFIEDVPYLRLAHITRKKRMLYSAENQLEQRMTLAPADMPMPTIVL